MAHILAIVSKAQFEAAHAASRLGDQLPIDSYVSNSRALEPLADGGDLFLVTVRPPNEALWLVAILEQPAFDGKRWHAEPNRAAATDLSGVKGKLAFSTGKGIQAKRGALGMSLQTPRRLTEADVELLRAAIASGTPSKLKAPVATAKRGLTTDPASIANQALLVPGLVTRPGPKGLEAEVVAAVDDLDVRRVLSDALLEREDPRGEFIRLSLLRAELDEWDPEYAPLSRALATLKSCYGRIWSASLNEIAELHQSNRASEAVPFWYRRGAVEGLRSNAHNLASLLPRVRKLAPICELDVNESSAKALAQLLRSREASDIRRLRLDLGSGASADESLPAVLANDQLSKLKSLSIRGGITPLTAQALAAAPFAAGLEELELMGGAGIGAEGFRRLLASGVCAGLKKLRLANQNLRSAAGELLGGLDSLRELSIAYDELTPTAFKLLFASDKLRSLKSLGLDHVPLADQLELLAQSPLAAGLCRLELDSVRINGKRLATALKGWHMPELRVLGLSHNALREPGARALADTGALSAVERLDLSGCGLGDAGAAALAGGRGTPELRVLELTNNAIGAAGMGALAKGALLRSVRDIDLCHNKCQNAGGLALAEWDALPEVRSLSLYYNWMGVGGLRAILGRMVAVQELGLHENNYSVEPARALAKSETICDLRTLALCGCDERWMDALVTSPAVQRLEELRMSQCSLSEAGAKAIAELPCMSGVRVSFCHLSRGAKRVLRDRFGSGISWWPDANYS